MSDHSHDLCHDHPVKPRVDRRSFLKVTSAGAISLMGASLGMPNIVLGAPGSNKTLVKIFMRGGADGLVLFPPYKDPNYYRLRPTIAIAAPDAAGVDSAIDLNGTVGMNPNLLSLKEIWDSGRLAVAPGTHFSEGNRSHFDCQRWIEVGTTASGAEGVFNRYLQAVPGTDPLRAVRAGSSNLATSLSGGITVPAIQDGPGYKIVNYDWCSGNDCADNQLTRQMQTLGNVAVGNSAERLTRSVEKTIVTSIATIQDASLGYKTNAGGMEYTDGLNGRRGTALGRGLALVAQLLKKNIPVEVAAIDWDGNWDTHEGLFASSPTDQAGGNAKSQKTGADNLLTFWRDLGALRDNVVVMIGTEFGREAYENGTKGSDHGVGSAWMSFGGPTKGGIYGPLPALTDANLKEGRFVPETVNYKDLMAEVMVRHLRVDQALLPTLFPGRKAADFVDYKMFTRA